MDSAERFYRQLDKMQGLYPQLTFRRAIQEVQRAFEEAMGHVPSTLVEAIFLRFLDSFNQSSLPEQSFIEYSYRLGPYIDVFWKRYDPTEDPISKEEWVFLKEAVSESAGDLDLGLLTYVMQILMDKGLI
ncbi:MAG: hypothetical protein SNJ78_06395 [Spirochaetales bacterium]